MKSMSLKRGHARLVRVREQQRIDQWARWNRVEFKLQILLPPLKVNLGSMNFNKTEHAVFAETFVGEADQNRKVALNVLNIPLVLSQGPRGGCLFYIYRFPLDFRLSNLFLSTHFF